MRRSVVFDLGNVVIGWDRRGLYDWLIPDPKRRGVFLGEVLTLEANARLDAGVPLDRFVADLAEQHPQWSGHLTAFATHWRHTLGAPISGTLALLGDLSDAGVSLYALSNWGRDTFAQVEHELTWLSLFDGVMISGREGVAKPEPAIFTLLCERHGLEPGRAVFVDDGVVNVEAARRLGFDGIVFTGADALRADLTDRGYLPSE